MRAIRPGADVPDGSTAAVPADPLAAAADLRWSRPDLTAALADHVLETAAAVDDRDRWLAAAGWAVHARSATGDGRDTAADVIGGLAEWGPGVLDGPAAGRLRVELALVAVNAGESAAAAALLEPVLAEHGPAELRGDAFGVLARCAVDDDPDRVDGALECAGQAWAEVEPPLRELGGAAVALVAAAAHRRSGRPSIAAERAADGLAELERAREATGSGPRSGHLAAALAAEWILSLLDAGDAEQARQGCAELAPRLEHSRPSRQLARLRLAVARTNAVGSTAAETAAHTLGQAVRDAAECDAPDLEALCCSALGAVYQKAGRPDFALTTVERGVAAQRRDRSRAERFRTALDSLAARPSGSGPAGYGGRGAADTTRPLPVGPVAGEPVTALLPAPGRSSVPERGPRSRHGRAVDRAWQLGEYAATGADTQGDDAGDGAAPTGGNNGSRSGRGGGRGPARPAPERSQPAGRPERAQTDQRPGGRSAGRDVRRGDADESPAGDSLMRGPRPGNEPEEPADDQTELLRVSDTDDAPDRDEPGPEGRALGADPAGPASRHRLDSGINPIPPNRRRTAAEELEARRTAAGRRESRPAAFSAEWLAAELADLERIWERISQPAVQPDRTDEAAGGDPGPRDDRDDAGSRGRGDGAGGDGAGGDGAGGDGAGGDGAGGDGAGGDGAGGDGADPARGRARFAAVGDGEPGGAPSGRARRDRDDSSGSGTDHSTADSTDDGSTSDDDWTDVGSDETRASRSARRAAAGADPADDEQPRVGADEAGSGLAATAWTLTRPAGRGLPGGRRRADPEPSADGAAGNGKVGDRAAASRAAAQDAARPAGRRRRPEPDDAPAVEPERRSDDPFEGRRTGTPAGGRSTAGANGRRRAEIDDDPAEGAPLRRDGSDDRDGARAGRRRAEPEPAADEAGDERPTGRRASGTPAAKPAGPARSGRGARQAANARAETAMFPAVRPEPAAEDAPRPAADPVSAADAALFGPLPAELLEPVLAEPTTSRPAERPPADRRPVAEPRPAADPPDTDGCVVGIDIAREGRRLVGRRSARVLRTVAEALGGRLPAGGRIDEDEPGVVVVRVPGWSRAAATEWMRGRLPGVLDGFAGDPGDAGDLAGMNLRAAVRNSDGPVGAQLLQRLDAPAPRGPGAAPSGPVRRDAGGPQALERPGGGGRRRADDRSEPERSAPPPFTRPVTGRHGSGETGVMSSVVPGRHGQDKTDPPAGRGTSRPDPAAEQGTAGQGTAPRGGRRRADDPAPDGPRAAPEADPAPAAGAARGRERADGSTEGLGLADLLAGALAEYRGI
ncbi:hypothetical protein [Pseudonocardia humida]|uniref:Syndecan 1 n=1 Tax=Pseudonocardia humida TaxID=2800819 RepID=A0ABT0ZU54_9PSEU|nr:hypothetical protein [Pseudonocardia humida]MCO1654265.1 hypothetical protein [Pseudonocardia humida]